MNSAEVLFDTGLLSDTTAISGYGIKIFRITERNSRMTSKQTFVRSAMAVITALALVIPAYAATPAKKALPSAIASAFAKDYPNAKILNWSTEKDNGTLCYEVESMDGKTRRDLIYSAEGKALEIEERVQPTDLPQPVALAIAKAYPGGVVKSAEKLTRGSFTGYEVSVRVGKKSHELALDSAGTIQKAPAGKSENESGNEKEN